MAHNLYGCEVSGSEKNEQIEIFYRNFLRSVFHMRKSAPSAMVFAELGREERKFTVWRRMETFCRKLSHDKIRCIIDQIKEYDKKWLLGVKNFLLNCGKLMVDTYVNYIGNAEYRKYIERQDSAKI